MLNKKRREAGSGKESGEREGKRGAAVDRFGRIWEYRGAIPTL
jgi:hypothetical protein